LLAAALTSAAAVLASLSPDQLGAISGAPRGVITQAKERPMRAANENVEDAELVESDDSRGDAAA
jgi:hypothetical protein